MDNKSILIIEPFYSGSHKQWVDSLRAEVFPEATLLSLPGKFWKWRMAAGAWKLAETYLALEREFDIILCSDMLNLPLFVSLAKINNSRSKIILYMHENQLTYPWNETNKDILKRDRNYGFINIMSCILADSVLFNSSYHKNIFLEAINPFLKAFPDQVPIHTYEKIKSKSSVLPIGLSLQNLIYREARANKVPHILWNHRWEHDKNPKLFFESLFQLQNEDVDFRLILLGQKYTQQDDIFSKALTILKEKIVHLGYVENYADYVNLLSLADILPVTSFHDFFGVSVVEAIAAGCIPLLPQRLSYPEHLDPSKYPDLFYKNDKQFLSKLRIKLTYPTVNTYLREEMYKYDWSQLRTKYLETIK